MPHFFLIEGPLGGGKTLTASILAHYWRQKSGGDVRIFSNFELKEATVFDSVDRWLDVADARGAVCLWDEAQTQFDRRRWSRNTWMTTILNMTRKLRAVHMFLNPVGVNLDGRILDLVEVLIRVRKSPGRYIALDAYEYQDKRYGPDGRYLKTLRMPWWRVQQIFKLNLYDTDQLVYPFPVPKTERQETELIQKIIEAQREAVAREKGRKIGEETGGWINPSDRTREREKELNATAAEETDESGSAGVLASFHPLSPV
ncbi:ATPase [Alicyclobacillaceae bacterium I2511]|nr:ATPase [Alicyclobacillaceae bacterium I2511]